VEKHIFGELNNGQAEHFPLIRLKKSGWAELICFEPELDNDQMYQASILSCEKNAIDKCLEALMAMVDVQDSSSTTIMLETQAKIQAEKVRTGKPVINFDDKEVQDDLTFYTEGQKQMLSLFQSCFKTRSDYDRHSIS